MATETTTQVAQRAAGPVIHLTEHAANKIIALLAKEGVSAETGGLRVGVQGGGCSGLSYAMRLDTQARDRDKILKSLARAFLWIPRACCISMAPPWSTRKPSCARALFSRIPTPHAIADAGVHLRRSGGADSVCALTGTKSVGQVVGYRKRQPLFLCLGAPIESSYGQFISHHEGSAGVLELPRAYGGHTLLLVLRQSAASAGT